MVDQNTGDFDTFYIKSMESREVEIQSKISGGAKILVRLSRKSTNTKILTYAQIEKICIIRLTRIFCILRIFLSFFL